MTNDVDTDSISDGFHTFGELYRYRMDLNALAFNMCYRAGLFNVHKSRRHSDGEECFGGGWFVVSAQFPTGQFTNHYEDTPRNWAMFHCEERERADEWDGHTPEVAAERLEEFLLHMDEYLNVIH